jgi:PDZ domain-containing secreted protein
MRAQRPAVAYRVLLGVVFAALLVVLRLPATAQGPGLVRIDVTIGKSHVVEVKELSAHEAKVWLDQSSWKGK